ncbi:MAG: carboxypeptidase-like regulatory domain-containing protein, partial [Sediminibacterium sp.]
MFAYLRFIPFLVLLPYAAMAQTTTASMSGTVKTNRGELLVGASIKAIHEPTGTLYFSRAGKTGNFSIQNLLPGGPYSIEATFINFDTEKRKDITVALGENSEIDFVLAENISLLQQVTVSTTKKINNFINSNASISNQDKIAMLPTTGRNLYEYLHAVPQVISIQGNEGAISAAGQNNRYNSFYVDGAVNNDVFGLAASGTNGGLAGASPLSMDAIDQFQVAVSTFDASLGNFTGAAINAVTRAGSNRRESSVYHFFSNRNTAEKKDAGNKGDFFTRTYGFRTQGSILQNKLFYFINIELQRELYTQPFSFAAYKGNTKDSNLVHILSNTLKGTYHYDPGSFLDNPETLNTDRVVARIDWNINKRNSLSVSKRYVYAQRINTNISNANTIHFSNDGYALFSTTHSLSVELKTSIGNHSANKLLITYTAVKDDREPLLKAFPRVRINDGDGAFIFGTDNSSTINLLAQKNGTLFDKYTFTSGKHAISVGIDVEYNDLFNAFIQNTFGNYTYASLGDFLTNSRPSVYQLGFSQTDHKNADNTSAAAKLFRLKTAVFMNDEMRYNRLVLNYGIRVDKHYFLNTPTADDYTNSVAVPAFAQYWDTQDTR